MAEQFNEWYADTWKSGGCVDMQNLLIQCMKQGFEGGYEARSKEIAQEKSQKFDK